MRGSENRRRNARRFQAGDAESFSKRKENASCAQKASWLLRWCFQQIEKKGAAWKKSDWKKMQP